MSWKPWFIAGALSAVLAWGASAHAKDLKIKLPRRSHLTPVQRLNQEGVEAVQKHDYEKAETSFYKAYLLDPDDPFTLNNLGYVAELHGQIDRAQGFYALAAESPTEAVIARASSRRLEGRLVKEALAVPDRTLEINHENVEAMRLLSQGRAPEADLLLRQVLQRDPNNVFTLNNLGVAEEMEGESQEALQAYDKAAVHGSEAAAVVALDRSWRGKPASQLAAQNAKNLRNRLAAQAGSGTAVAELNVRGVSALNRNDLAAAAQAFCKAYALDPNSPFAINNVGYLAEIEGDRETAEFFYERARALSGERKVGLATRRSAEGSTLFHVASESDANVEAKLDRERELRRLKQEPILLKRRDNTVVEDPSSPPAPSSEQENR